MSEVAQASPVAEVDTPLLEVDDLRVTFKVRHGVLRRVPLHAVDGISFSIARQETLALVGESGSGKSTAGRGILRLVEPASGAVSLDGLDVIGADRKQLRSLRNRMQMVFQDPYSSLDPSMVIADSIGEPLMVHTDLDRRGRAERALELLEHVGLGEHHLNRYPYEFSGGQRQRIAIARALAVNPQLLICDEAVSALDVSTQNQVINLLEDLQAEFNISYLFITHDLSVVRHIAQRVAVMYLGRIVESGPTRRIFTSPTHPYTQALLSAVPVPIPWGRETRKRIVLPGDLPDPTDPPRGCSFHSRCLHAMDVCRQERPPRFALPDGGSVECHLHTSGPTLAGASVVELTPRSSLASGDHD